MLYESALKFLKQKPWKIFSLFRRLIKSKASLKSYLATHTQISPEHLPYNIDLIEFIKQQKTAGQKIILCTASNLKIAENIAQYLNLFDEVIASDEKRNIIGKNKAAILTQKFGKDGYIYAGNSKEDIPVWESAREAILVNTPKTIQIKALKKGNVHVNLPRKIDKLKTWFKALRIHQWLKNILLFVPLIAAHQVQSIEAWQQLILAFLAFGFCASSVYITNDLIDLENDRKHPKKCRRPFASGEIPILQGMLVTPILLIIGLQIARLVNQHFVFVLMSYYLLTTIYSFKLKRMGLIDCITLAMLYTMRLIAGGMACRVSLTFWLLACAFFFFYSLALIKRFAELQLLSQNHKKSASGRDYHLMDASLVHTLGTSSGLGSVIIFALYLNSPNVFNLYRQPEIAWASIPILLFWVSWMWQQAHRGHMDDDPLLFAIKKKTSLIAGLCFTSILAIATTGVPW